jgi:hypothetical protein
MWDEVKNKIQQLQAVDQTCQLFGAAYHRYRLNPAVDRDQITDVASRLNVSLPEALKHFYTSLGNGIAGPYYGLFPIERLRGYQPDRPFQGVEHFKSIAAAEGELSENGYFEVFHEDLQGLIPVISEGCGHEVCLISSGEKIGQVVSVSCDGYLRDTGQTLGDLYHTWLDESLLVFQAVKQLLDTSLSMQEIDRQIREKFKRYSGQDLAISIMGIEKPEALFGTRSHKIYHGKVQQPWYEAQLQQYRVQRDRTQQSNS